MSSYRGYLRKAYGIRPRPNEATEAAPVDDVDDQTNWSHGGQVAQVPSRRFFFGGRNPFDSLFGGGGIGLDDYGGQNEEDKERCQFKSYNQYSNFGGGVGLDG
jgi:hypothetical protein